MNKKLKLSNANFNKVSFLCLNFKSKVGFTQNLINYLFFNSHSRDEFENPLLRGDYTPRQYYPAKKPKKFTVVKYRQVRNN